MPGIEQGTRYREIRRLGAGGMAKVTLAEDTVLGREVALKRVYGTGDAHGILRLKREAMVGASLNHPNLVFVYDAHLQDDGDVVIVMEYVEGETLADVISARGALPPQEALRILRGVAAALDAIHRQGIIHRDVKPANVLLGRDGTVKLADLGVADVADRTRITSSGAVVGSFSYMAPEQLDGAAPSPAMDVYALAAVAFEMLTGVKARPESNPLALAHAISTQPPPDLQRAWPAAPAEAAAVLKRGMSADPALRPRSAGELVRRLDSALAPAPATEAAPAAAGPPLQINRPAHAVERPPSAARPQVSHGRPLRATDRERRSALLPALLALAALAIAGAVVAIVTSGGAGKKLAGTSTTTAQRASHQPSTSHRPSTTASRSSSAATTSTPSSDATTSTPSSAATTSTPSSGATTSTPSSAAPPAAAGTATSASATPAAAVEQFYTYAAAHQYPQAWALADQNLRNQLGGYAAFQNLMGSVRSITFHRADTTPGNTSSTATVAVATTSVQTGQSQQCTGTAQTVRAGGRWLVDRVSINCA